MKKTIQKETTADKQDIYVMVKATLPSSFNQCIWDRITLQSAVQYLQTQYEIMKTLLADYRLFSLLFVNFYRNHEQINNWYLLAHENKNQIKPYVFRTLLSKDCKQYRYQMKDKELKKHIFKNSANSMKSQKQNSPFDVQHRQSSLYKQHLSKVYFNRNKQDTKAQQKEQPIQAIGEGSGEHISKEDYHELFLKTFLACDGHKYIYYDFHRHMNGIQQSRTYNNFIRVKKLHKPHNSFAFRNNQNESNQKKHLQSQTLGSSFYLHEQEESLEDSLYNTFTVDPLGCVQTPNPSKKQKNVFRKMPNCFKRARQNLRASASTLKKVAADIYLI